MATSAYQVEGVTNKGGRGPCIWDPFVKLPDGTGRINWERVAYYNRLIEYMLEKGITPYANLYHYDLPLALEEKYLGLLSDQVINDFANYAEFCFSMFVERVKNWFTFNEPRVIADLGYGNGINPPSRCSKAYGNCTAGNSGTEPYIVAHHLILSHATAAQRYHGKYQKTQKGRIGILLDFSWFMNPIVYGEYPRTMQEIVGDRLPKFTEGQVKIVKGSADIVGVNMYTSSYMLDPHYTTKPKDLSYQMDWNAGLARMDDPGNGTLPEGLYDTTRINYYKGYISEMKKAMDNGANVIGYFAWSIVDNFEWRSGYSSRFGILYIDWKNNLKRIPKLSAHWFRQLLVSAPAKLDSHCKNQQWRSRGEPSLMPRKRSAAWWRIRRREALRRPITSTPKVEFPASSGFFSTSVSRSTLVPTFIFAFAFLFKPSSRLPSNSSPNLCGLNIIMLKLEGLKYLLHNASSQLFISSHIASSSFRFVFHVPLSYGKSFSSLQ
ncbi:hypothetical protein FEM48_Zijuj10G0092800 [Ziziphus jujuba var. spinosa]|uniref:Beta-glucosidase 44-like n=1 Tax=Ziziphus jujuba var. spinosa TaxID=714518 RepID=A0A978UMJ3_ZIZJJ|nr:hypothetical protein FEM48_Zijuj10G0092800 [Ziziphus jujuba var. spinosa]